MHDVLEVTVNPGFKLTDAKSNIEDLEQTSKPFVGALSDSEMQEVLEAPYRSVTAGESITELASMAATLLRAEGCMIMLSHNTAGSRTKLGRYSCACPAVTLACQEWAEAGKAAGRKAIVAGKALLSDTRAMSPGSGSTNPTSTGTRSIIALPIRVNGEAVGVMNLISRREAQRFGAEEVAFAEIVAWFVGQALNSVRLKSVLSSEFAQRAIAEQAEHRLGEAVSISSQHPQQLARILAKSFYREMVKVGLDSGQIIDAASEIISQLSGHLKKHTFRRQSHEGSNAKRKAH